MSSRWLWYHYHYPFEESPMALRAINAILTWQSLPWHKRLIYWVLR